LLERTVVGHGMCAVFRGGAIARWRNCAALLFKLTLNLVGRERESLNGNTLANSTIINIKQIVY
jgi:hypothetical protein